MAATTQFLKSNTAVHKNRIPMNRIFGMEPRTINPTQQTGNKTIYQIVFQVDNGSQSGTEMVLEYNTDVLRDAALADFDAKMTVVTV